VKVLVTGATGFLGRHVARDLAARGHFVACLVRLGSEARLALPAEGRSERVSGDLTDPESLVRKPLGCDAAVHLAGISREEPASGQTYHRVHVEGVRNLLDACLEAGVGRLVHVSALRAAADAAHPYRASKFRGEELVRSFPIPWTILRPAMVYGPGSPTLRWMRRLTWGAPLLPVPVPGREARISPVFVGDLAAGIAACLERPEVAGRTFDVAGPEAVTVGEMVAAVARARGLPHYQIGLPAAAARTASRWIARLPGLGPPPGTLDLLGDDHVADPAPFAAAAGLRLTPLAEGLRRSGV
jgi:NADH dehydrogenase